MMIFGLVTGMLVGAAITWLVAYDCGWLAAMQLMENEIDAPEKRK